MKTKTFVNAVTLALLFFAGVAFAGSSITRTIIGTWTGECVSYVRSLIPSLPYGLDTFDAKKKIINSYSCSPGSAAIIDVGNSVGHMAYTYSCDDSGSMQGLKLREANWYPGKIDELSCRNSKISGCIKDVKIVGFYKP